MAFSTSRSRLIQILAAGATLLALGGCSNGGDATLPGAIEPGVIEPGVTEQDDAAGWSASDGLKESITGPQVAVDQAVIVTGDANVRTDDPVAQSAAFVEKVNEMGGSVQSQWNVLIGDRPESTVVVRIPAAKYEELVGILGDFGEVTTQSTNSEDVTQQLVDLEARKGALETSIARLTQLMATAQTTGDLIEAEAQLTQRQAELDSLNAQLTWLEDQVDMSTLSVTFTTTDVPNPDPNIFERAWSYFLASLTNVFYVAVMVLPWLLIAGALVWVALVLRKRRRERKATRTP